MRVSPQGIALQGCVILALLLGGVGCAEEASDNSVVSGEDAGTEEPGPDAQMAVDVVFPSFDVGGGSKPDITSEDDAAAPEEDSSEEEDVEDPQETPSVVITEIMFNPEAVDDGDGEWFELTNTGDEDVSLIGWKIRDDSAGGHVIEGTVAILAGETLVLGTSDDPSINGGVEVDYVYPYSEFILANGSDEVILEWNGLVVDAVRYGGPGEGWPEGSGRSISLEPTLYDKESNDLASSWCDSPLNNGGVEPGSAGVENPACDALPENECGDGADNDGDELIDCADPDCASEPSCSPFQEGVLVITEIMANPAALADAEGEWFEVLNTSTESLDLRGLLIGDGSGEGHEVTSDAPLTLDAGQRAVFAASTEAVLEGVTYVWGAGFGSLKNKEGAVVVAYGALILDRVDWSEELGFDVTSGVSLSLSSDLENPESNDLASSWCPGEALMENGDLGTPGGSNPVCPEPSPCGNGTLEPGELCDDGNTEPGDGCEPDCTPTPAICGDEVLDDGEQCDDGNAESGDGCSSLCQVEEPVEVGTVIITEFMADPVEVGDSDGEWFEVYNTSTESVAMNGWTVLDGDGVAFVIPLEPPFVLEPASFGILGRSEDTSINGGVAVDVAYGSSLNLPNSGGTIGLSWAGVLVDEVNYGADGFEVFSGISTQLDQDTLTWDSNDLGENWCSAEKSLGSTGTPGSENGSCTILLGTCGDGEVQDWEACDDGNEIPTDGCENDCTVTPIECGNGLQQPGEECDDGNVNAGDGCEPDCTFTPAVCGNDVLEDGEECDDGNTDSGDGCEEDCTSTPIEPGDIVVTEFMQNPSAVNDSAGEWFEIYNASNMVINLEGWTLEDQGTNSHTLSGILLLAPGELAVLGAAAEGNGGVEVDYVYSSFQLNNSGDEIVLKTADGLLIDQVVFDSNSFPAESGAAVSLGGDMIDELLNDNGENWCLATTPYGDGDLGTPGLMNPPCNVLSTCGNAACEPLLGENCANCEEDCGSCGSCDTDFGPGCPDCSCEDCVCDLMPTCCTEMWTASCAALCGSECGGELCPLTGCEAMDIPGSGGAGCEACVCAEDETCCTVAWDEQCAVKCGNECGQDCGAANGCQSSQYPGAPEAACEDCVCAQNPSCCDTAWGPDCVELCDLCGGECLSSGCGVSELPGCNACECKNCVCAEDPTCCDVAWDAACAEQCATCGQDCGSSGCEPSSLPGCDNCACEATVCAQNPSCCDTAWDFSCAVLCIESGQDCGNAGCEPSESPGCDGCLCEACVCDQDPSCCSPDGEWTAACAQLCMACGQPCPKDGCSASAFAGCDGCSCETCVCEQDPLCCSALWDESCAALCDDCGDGCGFACGNGVQEPGEACDAGGSNSDTVADACRTTCTLPSCGDGVVDTGETCDDQGQVDGDGCSAVCQVEGITPQPGDLIITELMVNPETIVDGLGEWFEFWNGTEGTINLSGVQLTIGDADNASLQVSWVIPSGTFLETGGTYVVSAMNDFGLNGNIDSDLGFAPGAQLPNTGNGVVTLALEGLQIDTVVYGLDAGFNVLGGASLSLDANQYSSVANDNGEAWCLGTSTYGQTANLGTPGATNPVCPFCGDGTCGDGESCDNCSEDCGSCDTGCVPSESPGCANCPCEAAACDLIPSCCTTEWTQACVDVCVFLSLCP